MKRLREMSGAQPAHHFRGKESLRALYRGPLLVTVDLGWALEV